ncbi:MAG TPA: GntR family transcriptional regulator [Pyrinomonadaceae bacterium]|nr:GntR family transcriptional regulator [Pyrinomonadaceae bacterium]
MFFKPNQTSGVPIYVQLMEQVKHAVETGALRAGDQLPPIRKVAEDLVVNPNTVAKVYRELEHEGVIELRHGAGAFVTAGAAESEPPSARAERLRKAQAVVRGAATRLDALGLSEEEMRRLFEGELTRLRVEGAADEEAETTTRKRG